MTGKQSALKAGPQARVRLSRIGEGNEDVYVTCSPTAAASVSARFWCRANT